MKERRKPLEPPFHKFDTGARKAARATERDAQRGAYDADRAERARKAREPKPEPEPPPAPPVKPPKRPTLKPKAPAKKR